MNNKEREGEGEGERERERLGGWKKASERESKRTNERKRDYCISKLEQHCSLLQEKKICEGSN